MYISLIDAATDILVVSDHRDGVQSLPIVHMLKHANWDVSLQNKNKQTNKKQTNKKQTDKQKNKAVVLTGWLIYATCWTVGVHDPGLIELTI